MAAPSPQTCSDTGPLTISWVAVTPTPAFYTVRYRKVTSPASGWNTTTTSLTSIVVTVELCYNYEVEIQTDCGGTTSSWSATIATRPTQQVYITASAPTLGISGVSNISGYTFDGPVGFSGTQSTGGTHLGGNYGIAVDVSGTATANSSLRLYRNGILQECINIPINTVGATYNFTNLTFDALDEILISLTGTSC